MPKPRMTAGDKYKKRPIVLRYWAYKDEITLRARQAKFTLGNRVECIFYLPMPKGWSDEKKKRMKGQPHKYRPDVDNLAKAIMDIFFDKDETVYKLTASKFWGDEGEIILL